MSVPTYFLRPMAGVAAYLRVLVLTTLAALLCWAGVQAQDSIAVSAPRPPRLALKIQPVGHFVHLYTGIERWPDSQFPASIGFYNLEAELPVGPQSALAAAVGVKREGRNHFARDPDYGFSYIMQRGLKVMFAYRQYFRPGHEGWYVQPTARYIWTRYSHAGNDGLSNYADHYPKHQLIFSARVGLQIRFGQRGRFLLDLAAGPSIGGKFYSNTFDFLQASEIDAVEAYLLEDYARNIQLGVGVDGALGVGWWF